MCALLPLPAWPPLSLPAAPHALPPRPPTRSRPQAGRQVARPGRAAAAGPGRQGAGCRRRRRRRRCSPCPCLLLPSCCHPLCAGPSLTASPIQPCSPQKEYARCLSLTNDAGSIAAVHPDQAAEALAATGAFPTLADRTPAAPTALTGAWAARQGTAPCTTLSADADDVLPKAPAPAPAAPYLPPALRAGASATTLAGCPMPRPALPTPKPTPALHAAPYVPSHRRAAEQQAAAAAAPRPGRRCPFPTLTAGPQPAPVPAPLPLYRLALLYPSQPLQCF